MTINDGKIKKSAILAVVQTKWNLCGATSEKFKNQMIASNY